MEKAVARDWRSSLFAWNEPSQALPRQLSRRESQAVRFIAKVLGVMRKLPVVLLALPLGELSPQVTERARTLPLGKVAANAVSRRKGYPHRLYTD